MQRDIQKYTSTYTENYGFEAKMVNYRHKMLIERLNNAQPEVVIEIGCGSDLLYEDFFRKGGHVKKWVIVEPSDVFSLNAKLCTHPNLYIIKDFFENSLSNLSKILKKAPDFVICSALLHEVPSPNALLLAIRSIMDQKTTLHVNVPNSESLHRQLALQMGLISNTKELSFRNRDLQQSRVYDINSLKAELLSAKFSVGEDGGYLIKPFTHAQMENLIEFTGLDLVDGLFELGKIHPELASEIWVEAVKCSDD